VDDEVLRRSRASWVVLPDVDLELGTRCERELGMLRARVPFRRRGRDLRRTRRDRGARGLVGRPGRVFPRVDLTPDLAGRIDPESWDDRSFLGQGPKVRLDRAKVQLEIQRDLALG